MASSYENDYFNHINDDYDEVAMTKEMEEAIIDIIGKKKLEIYKNNIKKQCMKSRYNPIEDLRSSIYTLRRNADASNERLYYENQEKTAIEVVSTIYDQQSNVVFQLVIAMTQSGKTGCMLAIIDKCMDPVYRNIQDASAAEEIESPNAINPANICIITGLSSNDWRNQTKTRMPNILKDNVFHRGELKTKMMPWLQGKTNVLIIIDEIQIASREDFTINKVMSELNYKDVEFLRTNNINFVEFSATPNMVYDDTIEWLETDRKIHIMQPGNTYKGINNLLNNERVYQFKDLFIAHDPKYDGSMSEDEIRKRIQTIAPAYSAIQELIDDILSRYGYDNPKYHIIRMPAGEKFITVKNRFRQVAPTGQTFGYEECHQQSKDTNDNILNIIKNIPICHTFIFIKEALRCSITIKPKKHVGVLYERCPSGAIYDDIMVQGLAGRNTGYDVHDDTIVYTNIPSLKNYMKTWNTGFNDTKYLKYKKNKKKKTILSKETFTNVGYSIDNDVEENKIIRSQHIIKKTYNEITRFFHENICNDPNTGPRDLTVKNDDGFVMTKIRTTDGYRVLTKDQAITDAGLDKIVNNENKFTYRLRVFYTDINDITTKNYCLVYKIYEQS